MLRLVKFIWVHFKELLNEKLIFVICMRICKVIAPLLLLAVSCIKDPEPALHQAPSILKTVTSLEGDELVLTCQLSRLDNVASCGFFFGLAGGEQRFIDVPVEGGTSFSCRIPDLSFGVRYSYRPYVSGGVSELSPRTEILEIEQQLPGVTTEKPVILSSTSVSISYAVSETFSGSLAVCGVCWSTSPEPTMELKTKTVDSSEYGAHTVEVSGLVLGRTYYVRAYAINGKGVAYGEERKFYMPVVFDDKVLEAYMLSVWDADADGYISVEEAGKVEEIDICSDNLHSLGGLEHLTALRRLSCTGSSASGGKGSGSLESVSLGNVSSLESLDFSGNALTSLEIGSAPVLEELKISNNPLTSFVLHSTVMLKSLDMSNTSLNYISSSIPVDALEELHCEGSPLPLDDVVRKYRSLRRLYARGKVSDQTRLYLLAGLEVLDCAGSQVSELDLRYNPQLRSLNVDGCPLRSLNLTLNPELTFLSCLCDGLETLYLIEGHEIDGINRGERRYIPESTKIIYVPEVKDKEFKRYLVDHFDQDYDSFISLQEAAAVKEIDINTAKYSEIASLDGIQMFTSLERLSVPGQAIGSLALEANAALEVLVCDSNPLTSIDLTGNRALKSLYCQSTLLTALDLSGNPALEEAYLSRSPLKALDLSGNAALKVLDCSNAALEALDISCCPLLKTLDCRGNPALSSISVAAGQTTEILKDEHTDIKYF